MIVLDASVILKWLFHEEGSDKALSYRAAHVSGEDSVAVPELFFYEAANVLATKTALRGGAAKEAFALLWDFDFEVFSFGLEDILKSMSLSERYRISLYDAVYIELSGTLKSDFITTDRRLYEKVKGIKGVKLLG